jgi:predicted Zn-ribbon and HTH transcriptional regulator
MIINDKNILLDPKKDITEEDVKTIPGLKELRDSIADVEAAAKKATGRKKYLLNKQIIEMRKDQYVIKNIFKQPMYSRNLIKTLTRTNLDEKITINAAGNVESTGIINIYNPAHVVILLCNYAGLKMETYDDFNSDIKWMLIDFENIVDKALKEKYPLYYKLLIYKIDGKTNLEIQSLLEEEFGIKYSIEYISSLWRNKIPKLISQQAECDWLEWHYTEEEYGKWKRCSKCKKIKLADNRFFTKNNTSKDGLYSICKECRNSKTKIKSKGEIS